MVCRHKATVVFEGWGRVLRGEVPEARPDPEVLPAIKGLGEEGGGGASL